jgi:hypothetical protein
VTDIETVQLEILKAFLQVLVLAVGWFFGQRIIARWDVTKKRQELDIAAAERFQRLYGDLKEVARLWRTAKRPKGDAPPQPPDLQWRLMEKGTAAENQFEALLIKLTTERALTRQQQTTLGLFRQAAQEIRESIRQGEVPPSSDFGAEYLLFNDLAAEVTCLIGTNHKPGVINSELAKANLEAISLIRSSDWRKKVRDYEVTKLPRLQDPPRPLTADSKET